MKTYPLLVFLAVTLLLLGCIAGGQLEENETAKTKHSKPNETLQNQTVTNTTQPQVILDSPDVVTVVNSTAKKQKMLGFGTTIQKWNDDELVQLPSGARATVPEAIRQEILDKLYLELKLNRARYGTAKEQQYIVAAQNRGVTDWSYMGFVPTAAAGGKRSPGEGPDLAEGKEEVYIETAIGIMLDREKNGISVPYWDIVNEPSNPQNEPKRITVSQMVYIIKELGKRIEENNLSTKMIFPDDVTTGAAIPYIEAILSDSEARKYVGAIAFHEYGSQLEEEFSNEAITNRAIIKNLSLKYNVPIWMTETMYRTSSPLFMANKIFDELEYGGVSAYDYMLGYQREGVGLPRISSLIIVSFSPEGEFQNYSFHPFYYVMGQFSRFIGNGWDFIQSTSSDSRVRSAAFSESNSDGFTVVLVNNGDIEKTVRIDLDKPVSEISIIRTTESGEQWNVLGRFIVNGTAIYGTLPGESITTFTTVAAQ